VFPAVVSVNMCEASRCSDEELTRFLKNKECRITKSVEETNYFVEFSILRDA
jgi:hypothetical protein